MASPVPKFPKIIENLRARGFTLQVSLETVKTEIMRETGTLKDASLTMAFRAMVRLGYLKDTGNGMVYYIYQKEPYNFPKIGDNKSEDDLDEEELAKKFGV